MLFSFHSRKMQSLAALSVIRTEKTFWYLTVQHSAPVLAYWEFGTSGRLHLCLCWQPLHRMLSLRQPHRHTWRESSHCVGCCVVGGAAGTAGCTSHCRCVLVWNSITLCCVTKLILPL